MRGRIESAIQSKTVLKAGALALAVAGILWGFNAQLKSMFRDTSEEVAARTEPPPAQIYQEVFTQRPPSSSILSAQEQRSRDFDRMYEEEQYGKKNSLDYLKIPEEAKKKNPSSSPSPLRSDREGSETMQVQTPAKPKPRLKGMDSKPQVGSISGFSMQTKMGALKPGGNKLKFKKMDMNQTGFIGSYGDEKQEEADGSYGQADSCMKTCQSQSGGDVQKLQKCVETNPACQ